MYKNDKNDDSKLIIHPMKIDGEKLKNDLIDSFKKGVLIDPDLNEELKEAMCELEFDTPLIKENKGVRYRRYGFLNNYFNIFNVKKKLYNLSKDNSTLLKENYLSLLSKEEQLDILDSYNTLNVKNKSLRQTFSLFVYISLFLSKDEMLKIKNELINKEANNKVVELCHQQVLKLESEKEIIFYLLLNPFIFKNKELNDFYIINAYKNKLKNADFDDIYGDSLIETEYNFLHDFIKPLYDNKVSDFVILHMEMKKNLSNIEHISNKIKDFLGEKVLNDYLNQDLEFESKYNKILKQSGLNDEEHFSYIKSLPVSKIKQMGFKFDNNIIDNLCDNYNNENLSYYKTTAFHVCNKLINFNHEDNDYINKIESGARLGVITKQEQAKILTLKCFDIIYSAKTIDEVNLIRQFFEKNVSSDLYFHMNENKENTSLNELIEDINVNYNKFNEEIIRIEYAYQKSIMSSLKFIYLLGDNKFKILDSTKKNDFLIFDYRDFGNKKERIMNNINILKNKKEYIGKDYLYCLMSLSFFNNKWVETKNIEKNDIIQTLFSLAKKMSLIDIKNIDENVKNNNEIEKIINIMNFDAFSLFEYCLINTSLDELLNIKVEWIDKNIEDKFKINNLSGFYYKKVRELFFNKNLQNISLRNEKDAERILNIIHKKYYAVSFSNFKGLGKYKGDMDSFNPDDLQIAEYKGGEVVEISYYTGLFYAFILILMFLKEKKGMVKPSLMNNVFSFMEKLSYNLSVKLYSLLMNDEEYSFIFKHKGFKDNENLNIFMIEEPKEKMFNRVKYNIKKCHQFNFLKNLTINVNALCENEDTSFSAHFNNEKFKEYISSFKEDLIARINEKTQREMFNAEIFKKISISETIPQEQVESYAENANKDIISYSKYNQEIKSLIKKYPIYENLIEDMMEFFELKEKNEKVTLLPRIIVGEALGIKELLKDITKIISCKPVGFNIKNFSIQPDLDGSSPYWSNADFGNFAKEAMKSEIMNNIFLIENLFIQESQGDEGFKSINMDRMNFLFNDDRKFVDKRAPNVEFDLSYFYFIITAKDKSDVSEKYKKIKEIKLNNEENNREVTFKSVIMEYITKIGFEKNVIIEDSFIKHILSIDEDFETKKIKAMEIINSDIYDDMPILLSIEKYKSKYNNEVLKPDEVLIFSKNDLNKARERFLNQKSSHGFTFCGNVLNKGMVKKLVLAEKFTEEVKRLNDEYPNFKDVTKYLSDSYTVSKRIGSPFYIKPILLAGPPGLGKTHYAKRVAEMLKLGFNLISCEKIGSHYDIFGSNSVYTGSKEGLIARFMLEETNNANPIIMFDEVDKIRKNHNVSDDFLLGILEKENAKNFKDLFLSLEIDLSYINIIGSANYLNNVSEPIKSRFKIFNIDYLNYEERKKLLNYIINAVIKDLNLQDFISNEISENVERKLISSFRSTRDIIKILNEILMNVAAKGKDKISEDDLPNEINNKKPWDHIF